MLLLALSACKDGKGDLAEAMAATQAPETNETSTPSGEDSTPQEDDTIDFPKVEF